MSSTVPRPPGPLHHHGRREVEAEAGDAAGCHPEEEGVAGVTTMEARPGVAAAAVEEDVVAVGVDVGVAPPPRRARMNQDELRRQMELLAEDAR